MPVVFWQFVIVVLSMQAFRQFLTGVMTVVVLSLIFSVLGYGVNWPIIPVVVALFICVGVGLDLHRTGFLRALFWSVLSAAALSLIMVLCMQMIESVIGKVSHNLSISVAMVIFTPLFAVTALVARWCVRREMHKAFLRGTARYNNEDIAKRRRLIDVFRRNKRS